MPTPAPAAAAAVAFTQQDPIEAAAARCDDWLRAHDLQPSADSTERRLRLHHGCTDVEAVRSAAMNAVSRALALAADGFVSPEELCDETVDEAACLTNDARRHEAHAALEQLRDLSVGEEHLRALSIFTSWEELRGELLPMLHEMIFYATVGATEAARRKAPSASSYGTTLRWPVALGTAHMLLRHEARGAADYAASGRRARRRRGGAVPSAVPSAACLGGRGRRARWLSVARGLEPEHPHGVDLGDELL